MERSLTITYENQDMAATLHYPSQELSECGSQPCRWPLIIICHGFVGSRIGVDRLFVNTARTLCSGGYLVLRFDYVGCGESTGDYGAEGLDSMIAQTRRVLDYCTGMDFVDANRVVLLGHSLGGAVAVLTAAQDKRVKSLVLWSAVANPLHDIVKIVGEEAYIQALHEVSLDYLGYQLKSQFFESLSHHSPTQQIRQYDGDILLLHGTGDDVIPSDYSWLFQRIAWQRPNGQCDRELIEGADHTYSSRPHREQLIDGTRKWLFQIDKRKTDWNDWTI